MNIPQDLRDRINFQSEFDELLSDVASAYGLGEFVSFAPIMNGYEDVNLKLTTTKGNYFVKIFAEARDDAQCLRLINIVKSALDAGVAHPVFLKKDSGYIFRERYDDFNIRLAVFEYIEGKNLLELKKNPSLAELKEIIKFASLIHKIEYKPAELYDKWALVNFVKEYETSKKYLSDKEVVILDKLLTEFEKVDLKSLPQALVHGDLTSANIMKSKDKIYIVDFSVANYYPRIVELAVLMSDILFDPKNTDVTTKNYKFLISEYSKHDSLLKEELEVLPLFTVITHAMHLTRAAKEIADGNKSEENENFLKLGKKGITLSLASFAK